MYTYTTLKLFLLIRDGLSTNALLFYSHIGSRYRTSCIFTKLRDFQFSDKTKLLTT